MIPTRLSVVTLGARDLPTLRRFYARCGWKELAGSDEHWAAFLPGGVVFALYPVDALDLESRSVSSGSGAFTLAVNVDHREDVDAVFEAFMSAGATALAEPEERPWGGRSAYVADPEANRWEVAWAPGAVFGERGEVIAFGS